MATKKTEVDLPITNKEVWQVLSAVDCSKHTQQKNGLTFLSWAWAWGIMMQYYPDTYHQVLADVDHADGTKTVRCSIVIPANGKGPERDECLSRSMWLPVMDYKNKAIPNPDARAISDARMRCMTKCLAMFGLGHYIYAGEDVPSESKQTAAAAAAEPAPKEPVAVNPPKAAPDGMNIPDAETAASTVKFMCETVTEFHSDSMESLVDFWNKNKGLIDYLDSNFPEQYSALKAHFSQIKSKITGN